MIFNSKLNNKSIAAYDPISKKKLTYHCLYKEKNKKIYKFKKSLILILAENSIGFISSYYSFIQNNHTVMLLSNLVNTKELNNTIKRFCPKMIVLNNDFNLNKIKSKINKIYSSNNFNIFKTSFKKKIKINNKIILLLGTSGSTGNKKWVKLSKTNLKSNLFSITKELDINKKDITITTLPPEYTYGLSIINSHLVNGAKIILNNHSIIQKDFWKNLKIYKVTNFGGVPFIYEILYRLKFENFLNETNIRYLTQAGGKLEASLHEKISAACKKNNIDFFVMYGSTETSPRMSILKNAGIKKKFASIGKAIHGTKIFIYKDKKKILDAFVKGEIVFKGKNIFGGYAQTYKDLVSFQNLSSYFTGDLGYFDNDGDFFIDGRKSRFIKIKGTRINLDEMEEKLKENLNFKCKILNKDEKLEIVYTNKQKDESKIKKKISLLFSIHVSDIILKMINNIPKTLNGKVDYEKLNKL